VTDCQIAGNYSIVSGERPEFVEQDDVVRTPSDHMCIISEFRYDPARVERVTDVKLKYMQMLEVNDFSADSKL
jgi:hypothetical protein